MQINGIDFTIGADPEFFVHQNGLPVSAHGLIPGDKKNPHKVGWGAVQVDGMALEFNIDPAKGEAGFLRNLNKVMESILKMVPDYQFYDNPVADFGQEYIDSQPLEAKILGCEPDYNAYTGLPNPTPDGDLGFRTASGHIHIGWHKQMVDPMDPDHFQDCIVLTKALDFFLGIPSLLWDQDNRRRELYGQAGAFRPKPYGMEYRVLSNKWLSPEYPHLPKFIYHNTMKAIEYALKDCEFEGAVVPLLARDIINSGDAREATNQVRIAKHTSLYQPPKYYREDM